MVDDPFIPELAVLNNEINEIKNNTLLQTLEERLDDSPFTTEISQLDVETIQLESISPDSTGINAMQLSQAETSEIIPTRSSRNRLIIAQTFIASFMLSLVLVFLMNALKEELGDLMLHLLFQAKLSENEGHFNIGDSLENISSKLIN